MNYATLAVGSIVVSSIIFAVGLLAIYSNWLAPLVKRNQQERNELLAAAMRRRDAAVIARDQARRELNELDTILTQSRHWAEHEAQHEHKRIIAEAHRDADRLIRHADEEAVRARHAATLGIRERLITQSLSRARERAQREVGHEQETRLIAQLLDSLAHQAPSHAPHQELQHGR